MVNIEHLDLHGLPSVAYMERVRLPNCAAVYFALSRSEEPLYIGSTVSLVGRWARHHRARELKRIGGIRIAWLFVADTSQLLTLEDALIKRFNPLLQQSRAATANSQGPRSFTSVQSVPLTPAQIKIKLMQNGDTIAGLAKAWETTPDVLSRVIHRRGYSVHQREREKLARYLSVDVSEVGREPMRDNPKSPYAERPVAA